jgi:glucans biosynthesis protein
VVAQPNPESGGWRINFELLPSAKLVELHAQLMDGKKPLSETWLYRWTP